MTLETLNKKVKKIEESAYRVLSSHECFLAFLRAAAKEDEPMLKRLKESRIKKSYIETDYGYVGRVEISADIAVAVCLDMYYYLGKTEILEAGVNIVDRLAGNLQRLMAVALGVAFYDGVKLCRGEEEADKLFEGIPEKTIEAIENRSEKIIEARMDNVLPILKKSLDEHIGGIKGIFAGLTDFCESIQVDPWILLRAWHHNDGRLDQLKKLLSTEEVSADESARKFYRENLIKYWEQRIGRISE